MRSGKRMRQRENSRVDKIRFQQEAQKCFHTKFNYYLGSITNFSPKLKKNYLSQLILDASSGTLQAFSAHVVMYNVDRKMGSPFFFHVGSACTFFFLIAKIGLRMFYAFCSGCAMTALSVFLGAACAAHTSLFFAQRTHQPVSARHGGR
jgi:hypothetical protein